MLLPCWVQYVFILLKIFLNLILDVVEFLWNILILFGFFRFVRWVQNSAQSELIISHNWVCFVYSTPRFMKFSSLTAGSRYCYWLCLALLPLSLGVILSSASGSFLTGMCCHFSRRTSCRWDMEWHSWRDAGSIPGLGRFPGEGNGNSLQYSCLENPHGQRSLAGNSPWGHRESDVTEQLSTHT